MLIYYKLLCGEMMKVLFKGNTNNSLHAYTCITPTVNSSRPHKFQFCRLQKDYKCKGFFVPY